MEVPDSPTPLPDQVKNLDLISEVFKKPAALRVPAEYKQIAPLLSDVKCLKKLNLKEIDLYEVYSGLKYREVPKDTTEIRYGEVGKVYYIILKGHCSVWVPLEP